MGSISRSYLNHTSDCYGEMRLKNWEKWMEIRNKFHEKLYKKFHRAPVNLLLNQSDKYRRKIEDRLNIDYANIIKPDKIRGNPWYWKHPCGIEFPFKKTRDCFCTEKENTKPSIFAQLTPQQKCIVPPLEYIGTPDQIKKEKHIEEHSSNECMVEVRDMWLKNKYKKNREVQLAKISKKHGRLRPDFKQLCVVGTAVRRECKISSDNSKNLIEIKPMSQSFASEEEISEESEVVVAIKIQNDLILSNKDTEVQVKKFYCKIDYSIPFDGIVKNKVTIKNLGNVTVHYSWKRVICENTLDILPKRKPSFNFTFKKTKQVLMLDQTQDINIYFSTNKPGVYEEMWELETVPKISETTFLLILWSCAEYSLQADIIRDVKTRIDEGVEYKIIDDMMVEILSKVHLMKPIETIKTSYSFITEKHIFESVNVEYDQPLKPSVYYYNKYIVEELKKLYQEIRYVDDPDNWNFNIKNLQYLINNNVKEEYTRNGYRQLFEWLVNKLLKTNLIKNVDQEKFSQVYYLLCVTVDMITDRVLTIRNKFNMSIKEKYPKQTVQDIENTCVNVEAHRIQFYKNIQKENFERAVLQEYGPQIEGLQNVTLNEPDTMFKLYHKIKYNINTDISSQGGKSRKKGKGSKQSKKEKGSKKGSKNKDKKKSETNLKDKKKGELKRFKEDLLSLGALISDDETVFSEAQEDSGNEDVKSSQHDLYMYNMYMHINELLGNAINDIAYTIESYKKQTIPHQLIQNLIEKELSWEKSKRIQLTTENNLFDQVSHKSSLSSISTAYSLPIALNTKEDLEPQVELVDVYTQTSLGELYPPKTQEKHMQTSEISMDKEYLVEQIEIEDNATPIITY